MAESDYLPITVWQGDLDHIPLFESDEQEGVKLINRLLDRRVDGLIKWPQFGVAYQDHLEDLTEKNVPLVVIDHRGDEPYSDTVATNEAQATRAVAKHLLDLGHRRIAFISSRESKSQTWALERRTAFEQCVGAHPDAEVRSWRLNRNGSNGVEVATELLASEFAPTAVFAVTAPEALCVYEAAIMRGLTVPGDLSVVGFADLDFAATLSPPLSTVRQRAREIGVRSAATVLDRLQGKLAGDPMEHVKIDADLILRDSTGPAPA